MNLDFGLIETAKQKLEGIVKYVTAMTVVFGVAWGCFTYLAQVKINEQQAKTNQETIVKLQDQIVDLKTKTAALEATVKEMQRVSK